MTDDEECWICQEEIECGNDCYSYESDGRCRCGVRPHCCLCGGSPYCDCCPECKECVAQCGCPITVQLEGGREMVL